MVLAKFKTPTARVVLNENSRASRAKRAKRAQPQDQPDHELTGSLVVGVLPAAEAGGPLSEWVLFQRVLKFEKRSIRVGMRPSTPRVKVRKCAELRKNMQLSYCKSDQHIKLFL